VPAGLTLDKDLNFDSIADEEPVIGDLICSSQASSSDPSFGSAFW
jgi:hypothetical protein